VDYHRFHYPLAGKASAPTLINGGLSSVNPIALRRDLSIFWQNKRNLSYLETDGFGRIASFEVGATCVGSMTYGESLPGFVEKGDEKGFFSFGGSSVLTLFEPNRILLAEDLLEHSAQNRELYARMGEPMGILPK
jgi:phosphatidylserine decarboxylase